MLDAVIVIVTRDRPDHLRKAVASCLEQEGKPSVLVYDDASHVPATEQLGSMADKVKVVRGETMKSYIHYRARAFEDSECDVFFWLDDDAYYSNPGIVQRALEKFKDDAELAALALAFVEPHREVRSREWSRQEAEALDGERLSRFVGCACAMRRTSVVAAGGLGQFLVQYGEERDLAIRFFDRGQQVRYCHGEPIIHMVSSQRSHWRQGYYAMRNALLFDMMYCPFPRVLALLPWHALRLFFYTDWLRYIHWRIVIIPSSLMACMKYLGKRRALSRDMYHQFKALPDHAAIALTDSK